eukprot:gnl/TRDRNA2_/TRDRNA2_91361_c0_seq1.p1 gnl/TRDRNA2_/TRDRNA2_91361_c0~~gnl/TRDRNA2_/TRDRNA2_91361_c0_seq1.p1  ORF type:complete len:361 (-),score=44.96 gnl/TRDRNA2_/TRDRNA2_91361_c0_seq1:181-1263(-)
MSLEVEASQSSDDLSLTADAEVGIEPFAAAPVGGPRWSPAPPVQALRADPAEEVAPPARLRIGGPSPSLARNEDSLPRPSTRSSQSLRPWQRLPRTPAQKVRVQVVPAQHMPIDFKDLEIPVHRQQAVENCIKPWYTFCKDSPDVKFLNDTVYQYRLICCLVAALASGLLFTAFFCIDSRSYGIHVVIFFISGSLVMLAAVACRIAIAYWELEAFQQIRTELVKLACRLQLALGPCGYEIVPAFAMRIPNKHVPKDFRLQQHNRYIWLDIIKPETVDVEMFLPASTVTSRASSRERPEDEGEELEDEDNICAICLEPFMDGQRIRDSVCSHRYHATCVDRWFLQSRKCPMCKRDMIVPEV